MKLRKAGSLEDGLTQAAAVLGWEGMAEVVGKSTSLLRKAADPDDDGQIQLRQALTIDVACKQEGGMTPLLDWYVRKVSEVDFIPEHVDLVDANLEAMTALGRLSETIKAAKAPTGPGGHRLTRGEQEQICKGISQLERTLARMKAEVVSTDNENVFQIAGE